MLRYHVNDVMANELRFECSMYHSISMLHGKQMPGGKTILDLPCLNECQDIEVMRLCLVNLMSLFPTSIHDARRIHCHPREGLIVRARDDSGAVPNVPGIVLPRAEATDCICGQNARRPNIKVERHGPSVYHATDRLAALGFLATKITASLKEFIDEIESLGTAQEFSASGMKRRRYRRTADQDIIVGNDVLDVEEVVLMLTSRLMRRRQQGTIHKSLLIGIADGRISVCSLNFDDDFPVGNKLGKLSHGKWVGILNTDECNENTRKVLPDVLPGKNERLPIECLV